MAVARWRHFWREMRARSRVRHEPREPLARGGETRCAYGRRDETCPVSTEGGTRRVQLVRERGEGGSTAVAVPAHAGRAEVRRVALRAVERQRSGAVPRRAGRAGAEGDLRSGGVRFSRVQQDGASQRGVGAMCDAGQVQGGRGVQGRGGWLAAVARRGAWRAKNREWLQGGRAVYHAGCRGGVSD